MADSALPAPGLWLKNVQVPPLAGLDLALPAGQWTALTGTDLPALQTLLFDVIYAEAQRRYLETFPAVTRRQWEAWEQPACDEIGPLPPAIAVRVPTGRPGPRTLLASVAEIWPLLQRWFSRAGTVWCDQCRRPVRARTAADVAAEILAWPAGQRLLITFEIPLSTDTLPDQLAANLIRAGFQRILLNGEQRELKVPLPADWPAALQWWCVVDRLQTGPQLTSGRLVESLNLAWSRGQGRCQVWQQRSADEAATAEAVEIDCRPFQRHSYPTRWECSGCGRPFVMPQPLLFSFRTPLGACPACHGTGGTTQAVCAACQGQRLQPAALAVRIDGRNPADVIRLSAHDCLQFIQAQRPQTVPALLPIVEDLERRLTWLVRLGLGTFPLDRRARDLSESEWLRARLVAARCSDLVETLCLVEHPADGVAADLIPVLGELLRDWQQSGQSILMSESEPGLLKLADSLWELQLGETAQLVPAETTNDNSTPPKSARKSGRSTTKAAQPDGSASNSTRLRCTHLEHDRFRDWTLEFPVGGMTCLSGSDSLVLRELLFEILAPAFTPGTAAGPLRCQIEPQPVPMSSVVAIPRSPPRALVRGSLATVCGVWADIRRVLADQPEAKARQFTSGTFSLLTAQGGRCRTCQGRGQVDIDLQFLPDVHVECPDCHGERFQRDVLEVTWRGLNAADLLRLTAITAQPLFRGQTRLLRRLKALKDVGLDQHPLGQSVAHLAPGEWSRLQLARALSEKFSGAALFLLEEPARGLAPAGRQQLRQAFELLIEQGHTLLFTGVKDQWESLVDDCCEVPAGDSGSDHVRS